MSKIEWTEQTEQTWNPIEAKDYLMARVRENLGNDLPDETEAAVSHWLQAENPQVSLPALTSDLRKVLIQEAKKVKVKWSHLPLSPPKKSDFTFIDLFAGIGGFRIAMQELGGRCVFSSEWDRHSKKTYEVNFGEVPYGDIRNISENEIPCHDILCAGFPCQPFSLAGVSARNSLNTAHGFACEDQGNLFFDIARIVEAKQPRIVFLENVRNLVGHDGGNTFSVIKNTIESLGYTFSHQLIDASSLVPQRRVRCYMVCFRDGTDFSFPELKGDPLPLQSILDPDAPDTFTISDKLWAGHQRRTNRNLARGTGFTAFCADLDKPSNTIVARYGKDGKECLIPQDGKNPRMLTPRECARLQGYPDDFVIPVAKTMAYRQFGNSVAVPVIRKISKKIIKAMKSSQKFTHQYTRGEEMKTKCEAFGIEVVRAILEGRQTQDRRPMKPQPQSVEGNEIIPYNGTAKFLEEKVKAPWQVGDIILVRESARVAYVGNLTIERDIDGTILDKYRTIDIIYNVDDAPATVDVPRRIKWIPVSGHNIPNGTFREACRTKLKITRVWAERLRDISKADAMAEGCFQGRTSSFRPYPYWHSTIVPKTSGFYRWASWQQAMEKLWDSFYGNAPYAWDQNPWVWCREFEVQ